MLNLLSANFIHKHTDTCNDVYTDKHTYAHIHTHIHAHTHSDTHMEVKRRIQYVRREKFSLWQSEHGGQNENDQHYSRYKY